MPCKNGTNTEEKKQQKNKREKNGIEKWKQQQAHNKYVIATLYPCDFCSLFRIFKEIERIAH